MSTLSRVEWGDLLFEAVFRPVTMDAGDRVKVINVTPRFIASAIPATAIEHDDPILSFCSAFAGITEDEALELYNPRWWRSRLRARPDRPPEFFAQLYLACLVASATEYTREQGQFQQRFSTLLGLPERDYLTRHPRGLPALWRALGDWLDDDGAAMGYVGLRVPSDDEVGGQVRIGHAKILAFPGYKDQEWLAKAARDNDVDVQSPLRDILKAMRAVENRLTPATRREYRRFVNEVLQGREFEQTPFWAAFEATSWRPESGPGSEAAASLLLWRVEPELRLEYGIRGGSELPPPWSLVDTDGSEWRVVRQDGDVPGSSLMSAPSSLPVRLGAYPRQWREGCLVMVEGEEIPWLSHLGLSLGDRTLLLLRRSCADKVLRALRRSVEPDHRSVSLWGEEWEAIGPLEPGEWMGVVATSDLAERFSAISLRRYQGGGPRLMGGVRTEIGWLINEATAPLLKSRARDVKVEIDGQLVGSLQWNPTDQCFAFPHQLRVKLRRRTQGVMVSSAFAGGRRMIRIAPCVLDMAPMLPPSLLYEGDDGQLGRGDGSTSSREPSAPGTEMALLRRKAMGLQAPSWSDADVDQAGSALLEAILGATCGAPTSGLSYQRMLEFLGNALPSSMNQWVGLSELVTNGHVRVAMTPHSPAPTYRANPVSASLRHGQHGREARLVGLIGQRLRFGLGERVEAEGGRLELAVAPGSVIPGVTRISGLTEDVLERILANAGIPVTVDADGPMGDPNALLATRPSSSVGGQAQEEEWTGRGWGVPRRHQEVRLTRRRAGDRPAIYTVHFGPQGEWRTQARQWAFWVWGVGSDTAWWDGSVVYTPQAPPGCLAERALLGGAGWCGYNGEIERWVVPLGSAVGTRFLSPWLQPRWVPADQTDAAREWLAACLGAWRGRYHPMLHRFGRPSGGE